MSDACTAVKVASAQPRKPRNFILLYFKANMADIVRYKLRERRTRKASLGVPVEPGADTIFDKYSCSCCLPRKTTGSAMVRDSPEESA